MVYSNTSISHDSLHNLPDGRGESPFFCSRSSSGINAVLESLLFVETRIPFAKLHVGDIGLQTFQLTECQIVMAVIVAVCCELPVFETIGRFANAVQVLLGTLL